MPQAEQPPALDWMRYDDVAEAYDRFLVANGYAALAIDLVRLLGLRPGARLLDVGCGTGAATLPAQEAVGAGGLAVGLDISFAMLRRAAGRGVACLVAGTVPGLPFGDRLFDGVAASLVLSHVAPYEAALRDMVRVLKPGGRLGVTAGAQSRRRPNPAYRAWEETVVSFVGQEALREAAGRVVPWEAWLTDATHVAEALAGVGLDDVQVQQREYRVVMLLEEYLSMLEVFVYGRLVRQKLGEARWEEFRQRVSETARSRCGERVEYTGRYHLGVGRRPCV